MRTNIAILAALLALAAGSALADQQTRPVIADATTGVIIWPNPTQLCNSNQIVRTDDALYAFITNDALVAAATGTVVSVASLEATITNIPAASITSGNIALAQTTNAAASLGPYVLGNIPVASITNALTTGGASIGGNVPAAALTNALATIQPAYASGVFSVVGTTQLVFIASGVTNVVDVDITTE